MTAMLFLAFVLGMMLGKYLADRRWRDNAKRVYRIESGGRLYKVTDAGQYDPAIEEAP